MGWRFRRTFRIAPGIRWNISKTGTSWSVGPRGFTLNFGRRGVRRTASLLGTGISHSSMISSRGGSPTRSSAGASLLPPGPAPTDQCSTTGSFAVDPALISPLTDAAAVDACRTWVLRRFRRLGGLLPAAVITVDRRRVERVRVSYKVRSRTLRIETEPVPRKTAPTAAVPDPQSLDPWDADIRSQALATRAIATCPTCEGAGRHTCRVCGGSVDVACQDCSGGGSEVSERTGKLINCRACRGTGRRRCPCRDGLVACDTCLGKAVATVWLSVTESERSEVRSSGDSEFLAVTPPTSTHCNIETVESYSQAADALAPSTVDLIRSASLKFEPDSRNDRVENVAVVREASEVATVRYELAGLGGTLDIEAWSGRLLPNATSERPFLRLRRRLWAVFAGVLAAGLGFAWWFASRHWYYQESPAAGRLMLLAPILAVTVLLPLLCFAQPRSKMALPRLVAWALPGLAVMGCQAWLAASGPSVERALQLVALGQPERALRETVASAELGIEVDRARKVHDQIQMSLLTARSSPPGAWSLLGQATFLTDAGRSEAERQAIERTATVALEFEERGDYRQSLAVLAAVPPSLRKNPAIRARERAAQLMQVAALWRTVVATGPTAGKLSACQGIAAQVQALGIDAVLPVPRRQVESTCASLTKVEGARIKREQEAQRQREVREALQRQAEEGRQVANDRALAQAPLLCRDGTLSSACVCGGSRRGCCSGHGGVAGCSQ